VGQNGARRFLGVEFGTGRSAGPAEVGVNGFHPLKFVIESVPGRKPAGHPRLPVEGKR
jgi:hypothetical protein